MEECDLHMLFTWVSIFRYLSNQHPRSLTSLADVVAVSPTCRVSMVTLESCCRVPMIINSVMRNVMRVYAAELIFSTEVSGFQTFKPVFCLYNKLRLHAAEMLSY